jgi:hypothetical protein
MLDYTRRCLIAALLVAAAALGVNSLWAGRAPLVRYRVDFANLPQRIGVLQARRVPVEKRIFEYLGADAMDELAYEAPDRTPIHLSLVYGTDWQAIHSPLSCFPQQGWQVDENTPVELEAPPGCPHRGPLHCRLLRAHRDQNTMLALYIFAHRGGTTADWEDQGWAVARSPRGTGGLLLSVNMPVVGKDVTPALAQLREVLSTVYVPAVSFWYTARPAR